MAKRILIVVVVAVAVIATSIVPDTAYSGRIPINWKVSGTFSYHQFFSPISQAFEVGILIDIIAKGAPGDAVAKMVGIPGRRISAPSPNCGDLEEIPFLGNDMVVTFEDQSMLFAILKPGKGYLCIGQEPAVFVLDIVGGTGEYEGVTGTLTSTFMGQQGGTSGILWAKTGTIVGEIVK